MRFLYDNKWDDYSVLSVTSEASGFEVENTQSIILSSTWRTQDSDISAQRIIMDAGVGNTITATSFCLSGHNLTSAATIKFEMNATDAWGAPSKSETITWRADHCIKFFTSGAYRFISVYIDDPTNTDDYLEVGRLFVGTYLQADPSSLISFPVRHVRNDVVTETDQGCVYATPGTSKRQFTYQFPSTNTTMKTAIEAVFTECGRFKPFIFCNYDTTYTVIPPAYVRMTEDLEETMIGNNRMTYSLSMRECG